ncbi:MAG: DUF1573 domain-containing protein [Cytophagia bacterium]|nr:MAG: DUF1573 domain-containing protein [Cytophagia bacterium]
MTKKIILLHFFMFLQLSAQDKKTSVSYEFYTHDFGTIKEEGGKVSYEFEFSNIGKSPLIIKNVVAACGCTVPTWTKTPIEPGEKGKISVEYDPFNRPGQFTKTLTVFSNSFQDGTILTLQGKVTPNPKKPHDDFPDKIGNLRFISRYMHLGDISTADWQRKSFDIFNFADSSITVDKIIFNSAYLNVKIEPQIIAPKSKAKILVEYSPKWRNDFGYVQDKIELKTNDALEPSKILFITANITLSFKDLTIEQMQNAPKISFDKELHDFGNVKQGDKVTTVFNIKNNGSDDLQILKIKPSCGCTVSEIDKKTIKSGHSAKLTITFDSNGKEGVQDKHINIYSNDPKSFTSVISLKTKILKP